MISVHETEKLSLQQIEQFLLAAKEVRFEASQREEIYASLASAESPGNSAGVRRLVPLDRSTPGCLGSPDRS
jgi:hypothetical protein